MKRFILILTIFVISLNCKSQAITSITVLNGSFITTIDTVKLKINGGFATLGGVTSKTYSINDSVITVNIEGCTVGLSAVTTIEEIIKINPLNQGIYKIKVRLIEYDNFIFPGCNVQKSYNSDSLHIKVVTFTSINKYQSNQFDVQIFPNPVKDKVQLKLIDKPANACISIINSLGQLVFEQLSPSQNETVDLTFLSTGIYYLKIQNDNGQKIYKLLKE